MSIIEGHVLRRAFLVATNMTDNRGTSAPLICLSPETERRRSMSRIDEQLYGKHEPFTAQFYVIGACAVEYDCIEIHY